MCLQLRKGADDRLDKIEAVLEGIVATCIGDEGCLELAAAQLLFDRHLSHERSTSLRHMQSPGDAKLIGALFLRKVSAVDVQKPIASPRDAVGLHILRLAAGSAVLRRSHGLDGCG